MGEGPPAADGTDRRYLSLVRELGALTAADCADGCSPPLHRREAAHHINKFLENPELIWKLLIVAGLLEIREG